MAQDFWASSGFSLLDRRADGLGVTDAWLARFLAREELVPPPEAGPRERELHARLAASPRETIPAADVAAVEDEEARENWTHFLRFRERLLRFPTLEAAYLDLYRGAGPVDLAPFFLDALAQAIVRAVLDGTDDPWLCRAGELFFRRQRVSTEGGQVLSVDSTTVEVYAETGGFGNVGRLLRKQNMEMPAVKMDVLNHENASFYFLRDELYGFAIDLTPGREGAAALAEVLRRWIRRLLGVETAIEPVARVEDERWRWHVGLDQDSTAILNALYRGDAIEPAEVERLLALFRLDFRDAGDVVAEMAGRPVYLGLACRPDRTLKMKPQNLVSNLPLGHAQ
ncbi:MAG: hypothetical protein H7Y14_05590 [Burkholderiales bacterium]|nr:hypothetical protein [Burkholderiales bacterium]